MITTHENQNTEWKEQWQDEYLKWICGFANAQGGTINMMRECKKRELPNPAYRADFSGLIVEFTSEGVNEGVKPRG